MNQLDDILSMIPQDDRNTFCTHFVSCLCKDKWTLYNVLNNEQLWDNGGLNRCIRWRFAANLITCELAYADTLTLRKEDLLHLYHTVVKGLLYFGDQDSFNRIKQLMLENGRFSAQDLSDQQYSNPIRPTDQQTVQRN